MKIYYLMFEKTGSRNWWPAKTDFEVVVGAILTQFVSWKNVEKAIGNMERRGLLGINEICSADNNELEDLIKCTRFYKQKAKKLKNFCCYVKNNYKGNLHNLFNKDMSRLRKELLCLYGIGEETADCIILYAAQKPIFVVDAYTKRIYNRLGYFDENIKYANMQKFFMDNLNHDVLFFNEYHAQIDGIGSNYCSGKNPKCNECPLNIICHF